MFPLKLIDLFDEVVEDFRHRRCSRPAALRAIDDLADEYFSDVPRVFAQPEGRWLDK